jgi:N-acetylglucosamine transport system permease protein
MTTNVTGTDALAGPPGVATGKSAGRRPSPKREVNAFTGLAHLALVVWALATAGPLIWVVLASFKSNTEIFLGAPFALPHSFSFETYVAAWNKAHVGRYFLNSVFVVALSTAGTMLFGSMAAYVLARYRFPGNRFIFYLFAAGMMFPVFLAIVPLFFVVRNLGMLSTYHGLILVYVAYSLPFTVFFMHAFFRTLPTSIAEAAFLDGCSHTGVFFRVMLPMAKPGLLSIGIFNVLGQFNQFVLPSFLSPEKPVLAQGIATLLASQRYEGDWGALFAALTIAMVPVVVAYLLFYRQVQAGLTSGTLK